MNKKNYIILSFIIISILLSGCIDLEINEYIYSDGSSEIEMIYNFEKVMMISQMMGGNNQEDFDDTEFSPEMFTPENFCLDFDEQEFFNESGYKNGECIPEGNKVIVKAFEEEKNEIMINDDNTYSFLVKKDNPFFEENEMMEGISEMGEEDQEDVPPGMLDMKWEYYIIFENDIIESPYGEIQGNKLKFDLTNLPNIEEDFYVTAKIKNEETQQINETNEEQNLNLDENRNEENNVQQLSSETEENNIIMFIIFGFIGFTLIIGIILFFVYKGKKIKNTQNININSNQEINPKIKQVIDWIHKYQNHYSEDQLKTTLKNTNQLTEEEIEIAFKNK